MKRYLIKEVTLVVDCWLQFKNPIIANSDNFNSFNLFHAMNSFREKFIF